MNISEIGAQIREARKKSNLSQAELAKLASMSRSRLSMLETGDAFEIGLHKILRICMILKLELVVRPRHIPTWEELNQARETAVASGRAETSMILKGLKHEDLREL